MREVMCGVCVWCVQVRGFTLCVCIVLVMWVVGGACTSVLMCLVVREWDVVCGARSVCG